MLAVDLLSNWPGISKASHEDVMASPAYGIPCPWPEEGARVRLASVRPQPSLAVTLRLGGEEQVLGLPELPLFPTVRLLSETPGVEQELLLAALEADAGGLFAWLEKLCQMQLEVTGLAALDDVRFERARAFAVVSRDGRERGSFLLSLSPTMARRFGSLSFLDAGHPVWDGLALPAEVQVATFRLSDEELSGLAPGDMLLLPELDPAQESWTVTLRLEDRLSVQATWQGTRLTADGVPLPPSRPPEEGTLRVSLAQTIPLSVRALLPLLQPDGRLELTLRPPFALRLTDAGGQELAEGRLERVGVQHAMAIEARGGH